MAHRQGRGLDVHVERDDSAVRIRLEGDLDLWHAPELRAELERLAAEQIEIDLGGLDFMDSTGLQVLLEEHERALHEGVKLVIRPGPDPIHRLFVLTGTDQKLPFA